MNSRERLKKAYLLVELAVRLTGRFYTNTKNPHYSELNDLSCCIRALLEGGTAELTKFEERIQKNLDKAKKYGIESR